MKALVFERNVPRYAAARVASSFATGAAARVGPLRLAEVPEPALPGPGWHRVRPRLAGICGSDLATVDARSSRYFEPVVSFPFVPGHEVVGDLDGAGRGPAEGRGVAGGVGRVVVEPVLNCFVRGIDPPCRGCTTGDTNLCERVAFGHLAPGLQTGFCADTGGGWSGALVAHESQLHPVPEGLSDEAAVMVEPTACGVHAAFAESVQGDTAVVIGAGTLGLCTIAALRRFVPPELLVVAAKHPEQRALAKDLGADVAAEPAGLARAVRRATGSLLAGSQLTTGARVVIDCVGTERSLEQALAVVAPRGTVVLVGMPGRLSVDLTPLWHREVRLKGAYAYGNEGTGRGERRSFDLAFELVREAKLERLVSALYPLGRYAEALEHAADAGRRGAVKVAFDLRDGARRPAGRARTG